MEEFPKGFTMLITGQKRIPPISGQEGAASLLIGETLAIGKRAAWHTCPLGPFSKTGRNDRPVWSDVGTFVFPLLLSSPSFWIARLEPRCFLLTLLNQVVPKEQGAKGSRRASGGASWDPEALCHVNPSSGPHDHIRTGKVLKQRERQGIWTSCAPGLVSMVPILHLSPLFLPVGFRSFQQTTWLEHFSLFCGPLFSALGGGLSGDILGGYHCIKLIVHMITLIRVI